MMKKKKQIHINEIRCMQISDSQNYQPKWLLLETFFDYLFPKQHEKKMSLIRGLFSWQWWIMWYATNVIHVMRFFHFGLNWMQNVLWLFASDRHVKKKIFLTLYTCIQQTHILILRMVDTKLLLWQQSCERCYKLNGALYRLWNILKGWLSTTYHYV